MSGVKSPPTASNVEVWARGSFFDEYRKRDLWPVEADLLLRYREQLEGRVLELGCGAGRVTGYLVELAREVHGIDLSPVMIAYCRETWPQASFHEGDFTDLSGFEAGSLDAVVAPCNALDILDDPDRRTMLDELHTVLADEGLLIMSSHNAGFLPSLRSPVRIQASLKHPRRLVDDVTRMPLRLRNRRRLRALERREAAYSIVNDGSHDYSLLHYFVSRDESERQLREHGFELLECLDQEGRPIAPGDLAADRPHLHYAARRVP
jgi:SAM-dependent methyltransferase